MARFLLLIAALALLSPARIQVWQIGSSGLQPCQLPDGSRAQMARLEGDLDGDDKKEDLFLSEGHLSIRSGFETRWSSPSTWIVRQALIADLNHDRKLEAVLLISRPFQPWPVDAWLPQGGRINDFQDSQGFSSHIILIGWDGSSYREVWAGSAMAEYGKRIAIARMESGNEVLVTLEAIYNDPSYRPGRGVKVWEWNGFGFGLVYALEGSFNRIEIFEDRIHSYLVLS